MTGTLPMTGALVLKEVDHFRPRLPTFRLLGPRRADVRPVEPGCLEARRVRNRTLEASNILEQIQAPWTPMAEMALDTAYAVYFGGGIVGYWMSLKGPCFFHQVVGAVMLWPAIQDAMPGTGPALHGAGRSEEVLAARFTFHRMALVAGRPVSGAFGSSHHECRSKELAKED